VFIAVAVVSALLGVGLKHQHQYTNHTPQKTVEKKNAHTNPRIAGITVIY